MKLLLSTIIAIIMLTAVSPGAAQATPSVQPGPCIQEIVKTIDTFIMGSSYGVSGTVTGNANAFITVPSSSFVSTAEQFIVEAQRLGFKGQTIAEFEAWLMHAGFTRTGGAKEFTLYERDRFWNQKTDGCGPPPPAVGESSSAHELAKPTPPSTMHGTVWIFGLVMLMATIAAAAYGTHTLRQRAHLHQLM